MANIRDLRQRITSVGSIQKITRAMEMVATTKLRRFQGVATAAGPYTHELGELVRGLSGSVASNPETAGDAAPLFLPGAADKPVGILFVGSDRGLCGAYNANIQRRLDRAVDELAGKPIKLFVIGRKAITHAKRRGYDIAAYLDHIDLEKLSFADATGISMLLVKHFREGNLSSVAVCSTKFISMARYNPTWAPFLPISPEAGAPAGDCILEPGGPQLLGSLVPRYLETGVYHALLEAVTSEYASRRFAMKNATDAAGDMKKDITRLYNRARQAKITSEISEIVGGAEALK